MPATAARRALLLAAAATLGAPLAGGCLRPTLDPKSDADGRLVREAGPPPRAAKRFDTPRFADAPPKSAKRGRPAGVTAEVVERDGETLLRLVNVGGEGPNSFGEFGTEGERPYLPVAGRAGYQQHTYVDEGFDTDVAVSPDARWMAYASTRHSTRSDIYLQRTGGLAVTKLTTDPADDAFPAFSPDGGKIAFCSNRSGNWDVYVMDRDGRNVVAVTQGPGQDLHPSFSPDGRRVAFCRVGGRSKQWEIWTADLGTGEQTMVGFGLFPDWSPRVDKDVIAFQRARQRGGRWFSLWTMELTDAGEPTAVTEIAMSTNAALVSPAWSPEGTHLAFATVVDPDAGMPDVDQDVGRQDVWTVRGDGTDRHRITDGKGTYATPAWATDGRVYFVSDRGGTESVWSAAAATPRGGTLSTAATPRVLDVGPATAHTDTAPFAD